MNVDHGSTNDCGVDVPTHANYTVTYHLSDTDRTVNHIVADLWAPT